jgi:hypothetical protein
MEATIAPSGKFSYSSPRHYSWRPRRPEFLPQVSFPLAHREPTPGGQSCCSEVVLQFIKNLLLETGIAGWLCCPPVQTEFYWRPELQAGYAVTQFRQNLLLEDRISASGKLSSSSDRT